MGQQVSVTKLKEQIEAAKRDLAQMQPVILSVDFDDQQAKDPVALRGIDTAASPAIAGQAPMANDNAILSAVPPLDGTGNDGQIRDSDQSRLRPADAGFQFFHRSKTADPSSQSVRDDLPNGDMRQRLDRLEAEIAQNRRHIHELITLLSSLDMSALAAKKSPSQKRFQRRHSYWLLIAMLVFGWFILSPAGHDLVTYLFMMQ